MIDILIKTLLAHGWELFAEDAKSYYFARGDERLTITWDVVHS